MSLPLVLTSCLLLAAPPGAPSQPAPRVPGSDAGALPMRELSPYEAKEALVRSEAAELSKAGKYKQAASSVAAFAKEGAKLTGNSPYGLERMKALGERYASRADWAAKGDAASLRSLMLDLLHPNDRAEGGPAFDARLVALLEKLRKVDPGAKAFFSPRKVKVVVKGSLEGPLAEALVIGLVPVLRELGFKASSTEGDEELALETAFGKELAMEGLFGVPDNLKMLSCELQASAKWTAGPRLVLKAELGGRSQGYADIPNSCSKAAVSSVLRSAAFKLFEAWNAQ